MKTIRLGTRPSALALWQANWTRDALTKLGVDVEIVKIVTSGDVNRAAAIANLGAQGVYLFVCKNIRLAKVAALVV